MAASKAIGFLNFKFGADLSGFERAMKKASGKLKKFGKSVQRTGKSLTTGLTLPIIALGAAASKMSIEFDKSMTKVITLVGIADKEVNLMRDSVLELSDKTGIAAVDMAEGLYFLTSAGLRSANALETLEAVGKATASGLGDMESLSKVAAAAQNAYGVEVLTAADALDVFGGMVKSGMFEANELSQVLGGQMGLAATLGISMEELGAFIATYTKTTGDATSATTGLEGVMMSFAKITPKQEKALGKIDMSVEQLRKSLSEKGLQKTLIMMASKFKAAGVDLSEFFSKSSSLKGVLGVLGNQTETYIDILGELEESTFKVNDAFDRTSQMAGFQMTQSFTQLKNAGIQLGDTLAPVIIAIADNIKVLAEWFRGLSESQKENIVKWGLILAAIGPVLMIIGKMSLGISTLIPIIAKLGTFLLANPYILLAAAIAAVVYVIYDLVTALNFQVDVQKELGNLKMEAKQSIAGELVNIGLLTDAIKDENSSLDDKLIALNTLKKTYPGYYDAIDETTLSTDNLNAATETLTQNLMNVATLTAYEDKLTEIASKLIDLEESSDIDMSTNLGVGILSTVLGPVYKAFAKVTGAEAELKNEIQENIDTNEYEQLQLLFESITGKTLKLQKEVNKTNKEFNKLEHNPLEDEKPIGPDGPDGPDGPTVKIEVNSNAAISKLKDFYTQSQNYNKRDLLQKTITEEQYNEKTFNDKINHLEGMKTIYEVYGESTTKIDEEILDAKLAQYKKEEKAIVKVKSKSQELLETIKERLQKVFGEDMDLGDLGKNLQTMLDGALQLFDAFNKKMTIKAENEKKRKTDALDDDYERQKAAIENSGRSEEQKAKMIEALDKKTANARASIEEELDKKLAKIKKREAIRNKAMAIVDAIINTATAVTKVLGQAGIFGIPMTAIVGAMGAIQVGMIASTPLPLAEGGIVSGPTQALIGEYPGAGSNPEVVAPLDKLKSMIGGGGNQHITVTGKLIGNDIFLSNAKTGVDRLRTV